LVTVTDDKDAPTLDQINLAVTDMEAAVAFYRRLGFDIPETDPEWDPHHRNAVTPGGLDLDLDSATFAKVWNEGSRGAGPVLGFRFSTREGVDAKYAELVDAGYRGQQPPYDAFFGVRFAVVEDPDGNAVGLMSPRDAAYASRPPSPSDW